MNLLRWQRPELAAWSGFNGLSTLRNEIDRLFEAPLAELARTSQLLSGWTPAMDMFEDTNQFVVRAELPGMKKEDIEISLHDGMLTIAGERKSQSGSNGDNATRTERFTGKFRRSITLPTQVDANKVNAAYSGWPFVTGRQSRAHNLKPR